METTPKREDYELVVEKFDVCDVCDIKEYCYSLGLEEYPFDAECVHENKIFKLKGKPKTL